MERIPEVAMEGGEVSGRKQKEKCENKRCAKWLEFVSGEARRLEGERDEARRLAEGWRDAATAQRIIKDLMIHGVAIKAQLPWEVGK